ncbi:LuxR C-terminal-related transcriptional regulator [Lentzea sp. JNUCC 0626]|uniref:LuxR C-terminal-related transcriptional regulator n=1 Tax=Lentzea sp. JNUCC 0626 TaxID=3367513 RepID=UPI0037497F55
MSDRKRELAMVREVLENAPAVVCVEGRVGLGKTAVLAETVRMARELGFSVFRAQCSGSESGFRFGVLAQLFESEADEILAGGADQAALHRVHRLVRELALDSPVLLAVDDVEYADESSLKFLSYLRRRLGELPVVVVVTRGLVDEPPLLREVVGDAVRVRLRGLDQLACGRFLRTLFSAQVPDDVVADWRVATGGNPFLLGLRPRDLGERSGELVARLGAGGADVVALARSFAVLGGADLALAGAAAGLVPEEAAEASRALGGMGFAGVPMVMATLAQSTTALDRAAIHARAARFQHDDQASADEVATHLLEASPLGEEWVRDVLLSVARRSTSDRAIACLRRLLREPLPDDLRGEVLVELSEAQSLVDPGAARASLTKAAGASMDVPAEGRMALLLAYDLAGRGLYRDAVAKVESVIARVSGVDSDLAQRLDLYALSLGMEESFFSGEVETRIARLVGSRMTSASNTRFLNTVLAYRGATIGANPGETRRRVHAALPVRIGRDLIDQFSFAHMIVALVGIDEYELADRQCDEALRVTSERDLGLCAALVQGLRCHVARRLGLLAVAEQLGLASLARLDSLGAHQDDNVVAGVAGLVGAWVDTGDTVSASALLRERSLDGDLPEYSHYTVLLHQRGRLHMALGDPVSALRDHLVCGQRMERRGARNPSLQPWRSHAALAHMALGEHDQASFLAFQELEVARDWGLSVPVGVAARVAGVVSGDLELLEEAVVVLRNTPARLELARALVDWGVGLRVAGRRPEALAALRQGHDVAKRCGAISLMGLASRELRAAGGRPARVPSGSVLTAQEDHIVRRAVHGLTNRQIAAELFVTPRAVELHLTRAYRKLGISGRRDLAAALEKAGA